MTKDSDYNLTELLSASPQGASIVFLLSDLSDFPQIMRSFARPVREAGRKIIHIRFVPDTDDAGKAGFEDAKRSQEDMAAEEIPVRLNHRFRHFTVAVHEEIRRQEKGTLFVFDCLSALQTAWATDLMMVNFFAVTTPLLKERGDTALFPLMSQMHSDEAAAKITQIADCFLEVFSDFKSIYLRGLKILNRDRQDLEKPCLLDPDSGSLTLITDGVKLSRFHRARDMSGRIHADLSMDSWDRFFLNAQRKYEYGEDITEECARMCQIMMSRDLRMRTLIRENFRPGDYFFVKEHMVGSGQIGGKSCGMLTARKIIENHRPELYDYMEAHDSFYIGSDVYSSFIVENGLWELSVRQYTEEGYFALSGEMRASILSGSFWPQIEQQFLHLLDYYGQEPVIVRSSSILEDGFDNAFAGKYDSVFVPNIGSRKERLAAFEDAVRTVYASTMSLSALDYRRRRGLSARNEEMAVLVMRVSGSHYGNYFMPCAAGVGYSCSPYRFLPTLSPGAGMLRLVMGLGTSAVDRTEGAYPRLVSLDQPEASPYHTSAEKHRYSQRKISLIDESTASFAYVSLEEIYDSLPVWLRRILLEHDTQAERIFRERGDRRRIEFVSCRGLTQNKALMELMQGMLHQLQDTYGQSVDIEFTINLSEDGDFVVNLLQCRPLMVMHASPGTDIGESSGPGPHAGSSSDSGTDTGESSGPGKPGAFAAEKNTGAADSGAAAPGKENTVTLLETLHSSMGMPRREQVDGIVFIDPVAYYELPYAKKPQIARSLGVLNWHFREADRTLILLTPGRIGTSSPELGVPTAFSDISSFQAICEIAESRAGYQPELSYGSHIFQDLVEADILYDAVFEDERRVHFHPEFLKALPNDIRKIVPDADSSVLGYYDMTSLSCVLVHDMKEERLQLTMRSVTCTPDPQDLVPNSFSSMR